MEDIINIFHIDWKLLIAQFVNFAIVFGVLYWYGLRKLAVLMDERAKKIANGVQSAADSEILKSETAQKAKDELAKARKEAKQIFDTAHTEAKQYADKMKSEADEKSAAILTRADKEAEAKKSEMIAGSKQAIINLAAQMTRTTFKELGLSESAEVAKSAIAKIESTK